MGNEVPTSRAEPPRTTLVRRVLFRPRTGRGMCVPTAEVGMAWLRAATAAAATAAALIWACGAPGGDSSSEDGSSSGGSGSDAGGVDDGGGSQDGGGSHDGGGTDAGPTDGGPTDGGAADGPTDGGGYTPPPPIQFPTEAGWSFLGPQNDGPHDVYQVTADQSGNIWVAGGEDGLFLLRPGATKFQRFTIADGLHPYGYLPDGSDPVGPKFLKVIAVTGGPANTVFVGYEGLPGCEGAWDNPANRPGLNGPGLAYVYKSGDADRVTVDSTGKLKVVHYDIFSGPGIVPNELDGREKLCTIYRIVWDANGNNLWFGGNHGFAWGDPSYAGNPTCDGQWACSGVVEHSHPAFNGCTGETTCPAWAWITEDYRGIAVDPSGDVWFGGAARTTKFHFGRFGGSPASRFIAAADWTENASGDCDTAPCYINNRIDVWPDLAPETTFTAPYGGQRIDDLVFGMVAMPDGTGAWVGSGYLGLRRLASDGSLVDDVSNRLASSYTFSRTFTDPGSGEVQSATYPAAFVGALALDTKDGSLWVGNRYAGGIDRFNASNPNAGQQRYATNVFGSLANDSIEDIQMMGRGPSRKVLVGFRQSANVAGCVAIYSGQ